MGLTFNFDCLNFDTHFDIVKKKTPIINIFSINVYVGNWIARIVLKVRLQMLQ